MSDAEIRVYACAHALFVLFSVFLVTDRCEGSPAILPNPDTGWIGMEYISEKLVKCRYTSSAWHLMPGLLGLFFSVVMLQHFATFQALPVQHAHPWQNSVFVALIVATTLGWSMIIGFDHRPAFAQAEPEYVWHFAGVCIFLVSRGRHVSAGRVRPAHGVGAPEAAGPPALRELPHPHGGRRVRARLAPAVSH